MSDLSKKLESIIDLLKAIKKPAPIAGQMTIPKLPGIKAPAMPSITPTRSIAPKIGAGVGPDSKKDPKKVAEQIKDGSMSTKTQKAMLKGESCHIAKNGQWSLEKASYKDIPPKKKDEKPLRFPDKPADHPFNRVKDEDIIPFDDSHVDITKDPKDEVKKEDSDKKYHLHANGYQFTSEPLTNKEIREKHGGVTHLENNGIRVVPHDPLNPTPLKLLKNGQWQLEPTDPSNV